MYFVSINYWKILFSRKWESKCLDLEHALSEIQLSRSALRKQLHKVMGFARDMVAEQETLLKALNQRHLENKAVKRIGSDMATKMDSLKNQLKVIASVASVVSFGRYRKSVPLSQLADMLELD